MNIGLSATCQLHGHLSRKLHRLHRLRKRHVISASWCNLHVAVVGLTILVPESTCQLCQGRKMLAKSVDILCLCKANLTEHVFKRLKYYNREYSKLRESKYSFWGNGKCFWWLFWENNSKDERDTSRWCYITLATKFYMVPTNLYGSLVWNLIHVTLLAPRILLWLHDFWKIFAPMVKSMFKMCVYCTTDFWDTPRRFKNSDLCCVLK